MSNPKECKYCRTTANGDDEPCLSLSAAHECPWMSKSDWDALDIRSKRDDDALARPALGDAMTDEMKCGPVSEADWKDQRIASLEAYIAQLKAALPAQGEPVAWRWRTLPAFRERDDNGEWSLTNTAPSTEDFINPHHHEVEPLYAALPSSPAPATTGDIPTGSRLPAPAAMGHSSGAGETIFAECAEIALEHVGSYHEDMEYAYDQACRDIAEAIKTRASNRKTMNAIAEAALLKP